MQFQAPRLKALYVIPYQPNNNTHQNICSLAKALSLEPKNNIFREEINEMFENLFNLTEKEVNLYRQDIKFD